MLSLSYKLILQLHFLDYINLICEDFLEFHGDREGMDDRAIIGGITKIDGNPIMIIVAGDAKIDNAKYKAEFHTKATMIPFDDVERLVGYAVGGVCPFGINDGVKVYLDISLKKYSIVYPAAGNDKSAVQLTLEELEKSSKFLKWVDVCK